MILLHVLRVFTDDDGSYGNALGVVLNGVAIAPERWRSLAAELGFAETVYVEDADTGRVRIFTPACELPLAGHPLVGTAWLLNRQGPPVTTLDPSAGPVATWTEGELTWIRGPVAVAPAWTLNQVMDAATVAAMTAVPSAAKGGPVLGLAGRGCRGGPSSSLRRPLRRPRGRSLRVGVDAPGRSIAAPADHPPRLGVLTMDVGDGVAG